MKSLAVDDDLTTRLIMEQTLSHFGEVDQCADGAAAVEMSTHALEGGHPYDVICLDIMMPNMSGLEALKLIRHAEQSRGLVPAHAAKVIIMTGADDSDTIRQAFKELCDAYVVKPIDPAELLNIVYCLCPVSAGDPV